MDDIPLAYLFSTLFLLIFMSAFFSSSETSMMALNRYRLKHRANDNHRSAIIVSQLLEHPDRLLGLILFGNNVVNILASAIVTVITIRLVGDGGILPASLFLTIVILIFAEVAPKTVAALHPEKLAFPFAYILMPLSYLLYPVTFAINKLSNGVLYLLGFKAAGNEEGVALSREELRTVVHEADGMIPKRHQRMLISILDLENITVEDIMVPRNEIIGVNLEDNEAEIMDHVSRCRHTRLPVFEGNLDNIQGIVHVKYLTRLLTDKEHFNHDELRKVTRDPYFVPPGTHLHTQLLHFQRNKQRIGLVVDEYGVIQGLVTLEGILEEIVGEFTTDLQGYEQDIHPQEDGSYIIDGSATLRDVNKQLHWDLPVDGPKTLNGLILEELQAIPETGTSMRINDFAMEVTQVIDNAVKTVKIQALKADG